MGIEDSKQPEEPEPRGRKGRPTRTAVRPTKAKSAATTESAAVAVKPAMDHCQSLLRIKGSVLRYKAMNLAMQHKCDLATTLLKQTESLPSGYQEQVSQRLARAKTLLLESLYLIEHDNKYLILQGSSECYVYDPSMMCTDTFSYRYSKYTIACSNKSYCAENQA